MSDFVFWTQTIKLETTLLLDCKKWYKTSQVKIFRLFSKFGEECFQFGPGLGSMEICCTMGFMCIAPL